MPKQAILTKCTLWNHWNDVLQVEYKHALYSSHKQSEKQNWLKDNYKLGSSYWPFLSLNTET